MQFAAVEGMKRFSGDPAFKFFYGMALVLEGQLQEGIRELDSLQSYSEVQLGSLLALIHAHKKCQPVDKEAVTQLDTKLKDERKRADDQALYYAGIFLLHIDRADKAKEYVDRLLKINPQSKEGLILKGWMEVSMLRESKSKNALQYFEAVLKTNNRNIEAIFGKSKYYELCGHFDEAIELLNQLIVVYQNFSPPLVEKMKVQLCLQDWDQADETANRILSTDPKNIEGLKFKVLQTICRKGVYEDACLQLRKFYTELEKAEPKNSQIFLLNAQLFSRICGRDALILEVTSMFAEKAASIDSTSSVNMAEVGYQNLLRGRVKEAQRYYKTATKLDESSIQALSGIISCQLHDKQYDIAKEQLDFLKEIQGGTVNKAEILYMSAILGRFTSVSSEDVLSNLNEAVDSHFRAVRGLTFGPEYLTVMNPDFVVLLVKEYLLYAPSNPATQGQAIAAPLKKSLMILEPVTKACPGLKDALYLLSKAKFLSGDLKSAVSTLQHVLDNIDPTCADSHLLMAQIQLHQGNFMNAQQSLEVGLSYNFEVRDHPIYHLINAKVLKTQGNTTEAIKTLQTALNLVNRKKGSAGKSKTEFSMTDKVSVYLELAEAYRQTGQNQEASRIMNDAMSEYMGTVEEIRITVANADLALAKGEVDSALHILRAITSNQPYYLQAREKMANIYLHHRKDKKMFAQCYREVVEKSPSPQSYLLLGDAYMSITEPERALEIYEQALKRNPRDSLLAAKMGQALQKTHQYGKALNYYKEAVKDEDNNSLRYDMAELQMRLKTYDRSEKTILQALQLEQENQNDLNSLIFQAKFQTLLAKVQEKSNNLEASIQTLGQAKLLRGRILKRVQVEQPDAVLEQKQLAAKVCHQMAEHSVLQRNYDAAIQFYKEALQFHPDDDIALCALAKLYLMNDDLDQCQYTCMTLLRNDKENEEATIMMADLAFRKNDYESAMFHFQQLLTNKPDYWVALARLVEVMRRTGHLEDVPEYLQKSEEHVGTRSSLEPGLNFCKGLFEWYSGNPNNALKLFNKARRDNEWGQRSIYNMIEICLNPDNQMLGGEVFESVDSDVHAESRDSQEMALRTADKLLKELKPKAGQQQISFQLLQGMLQLATKNKANIERALQDFLQLAAQDNQRENVGAVLGMATAYMLLKQTPRARNQLKRVSKYSWNFEDAEYLERCWLLLADIYIQGGKYDMASELLRKVLNHNKSATKAYEYMGFIMEKESSYKDAANHYEAAWKFSNQANPTIGYKLAFNYMKARRHADAIDVCHSVLQKYPNYPKIKKDILEKSRASLRS